MATAERISKPLTYEDFCALVKDGEKADLIDGVIHVASPDNTDANDINAWLGGLMFESGLARALGEAIFRAMPMHGTYGVVLAATLMAVLVSEMTSNTASRSCPAARLKAGALTGSVQVPPPNNRSLEKAAD